MPSTNLGTWSGRLLLLFLALGVVNTVVVLPATERRAGLEMARSAFALVVVLCLASAGVSGLIALVSKRERSWVAVVSVLAAIVVIGLEVVGVFIPA